MSLIQSLNSGFAFGNIQHLEVRTCDVLQLQLGGCFGQFFVHIYYYRYPLRVSMKFVFTVSVWEGPEDRTRRVREYRSAQELYEMTMLWYQPLIHPGRQLYVRQSIAYSFPFHPSILSISL